MKNPLLHLPTLAIAVLSSVVAVSFASAQEWPTKPIRIIVPAPPGGISDGVARLIGEQLRVNLGQPVIVDNKPGGSAVIAERALMSAAADGHTLMVGPSSVWTDFPFSVKTPFDPHKTFTYVADVASMVHVLVANTSYPPDTPQEILAHAQRNRNAVSVANLSSGTRSNLLGELLSDKSGRNILIVPYKGSAPAMVDLIGNQVQLTFEVVSNVAPLIKAGKLKGLAVVSATRSQHLPDVPSFAEQGMSDFVMPDASVGVFVLSSMPAARIEQVRREIENVMRAPRFRAMMAAQGYDAPQESTFEALQQKMADTVEQNRKILLRLNLPTTPR
ncbi:tripartite tricarboxylate transporter substrate binding protein [Pantoea sp. 18069]|uniref:Bug family tripartite tricarboxylate transporter substrate binding protein n=1 Tax=Pantoea sp. 18069 TaxID=2681415 RepID=UPI001356DE67|nr:tripartite tricarboxylate transporter substrate binding protein [Pantoea sp. 18069]